MKQYKQVVCEIRTLESNDILTSSEITAIQEGVGDIMEWKVTGI